MFVNLASNDPAVVSRAECSLRRENDDALVHRGNNELWTFSLTESSPPPAPNEKFGLRETSTGLFHASTITPVDHHHHHGSAISGGGAGGSAGAAAAAAAAATGAPTAVSNRPLPYDPFVSAVKSAIFTQLIRTRGFMPFGNALLSPDGRSFHANCMLTSYGDLFVQMYYEDTHMERVNEDMKRGTSVQIIPSALRGEFVQLCDVQPSNDQLATFRHLLEESPSCDMVAYYNMTFKRWAQVNLSTSTGSQKIMWPCELCVTSTTSTSTPISKDDVSNQMFSYPDTLALVEEQMSQIKSAAPLGVNGTTATTTAGQNSGMVSSVTSGRTNTTTISPGMARTNIAETYQASGTNVINQANDNRRNPGNVYPTPPDPQTLTGRRNEDSWRAAAAPSVGSEGWGEYDDDDIFGGDEVTEADFSFFDQPEPKPESVEPVGSVDPIEPMQVDQTVKTEHPEKASEPSKDDAEQALTTGIKPEVRFSSTLLSKNSLRIEGDSASSTPIDSDGESQHPRKRRKSIFRPLTFNPLVSSSLDSKYDVGGRFFVPDPSAEAGEDEDEDLFDSGPSSNHSDSDGEASQSDSEAPNSKQQSKQPESASMKESGSLDYSALWPALLSTSHFQHILSTDATQVTSESTGIDVEALDQFMEQVVWDHGLFQAFIPKHRKHLSPDELVVKSLMAMFPDASKLTVQTVMNMASISTVNHLVSSGPPPSRFGTPKPGEEEDKNADGSSRRPSADESNAVGTSVSGSAAVAGTDSGSAYPEDPNAECSTPGAGNTTSVAGLYSGNIPTDLKTNRFSIINQIPVPLISIVRGPNRLKARAPIMRFWKVFGLSPRGGPKNITMAMLTPSGPGVISASRVMLPLLKSSYEGCGLGEVALFDAPPLCQDGVVELASKESHDIDDTLLTFVQALKGMAVENVVLIVVNPFTTVSEMVNFTTMLQSRLNPGSHGPNVSLQFISPESITCKETLAMPSPYVLMRLSLAIYDKIKRPVDTLSKIQTQRTSPAFTLARVPPQKINFRHSPTSSLALMDEDSLIHVAYAFTQDRRWMTVAWTDQWGEVSKIKVLDLVGSTEKSGASRLRTLDDAFAEVWDTTLELTTKIPVRWRVAMVKVGKMDDDELSKWQLLSVPSVTSKKISFCYFLYVDMNPSLVITGDQTLLYPHGLHSQKKKALAGNHTNYPSPVKDGVLPTTPNNPIGDSPDAVYGVNVATPSSSHTQSDAVVNDEDSAVVDVKDETYGIVMGCLSDKVLPGDQRPRILVSGYLVKPPLDDAVPEQQVLEVNFVACPTPYEGSMKSILMHYRRLATLGGYTGVSQVDHALAPWHIEAADKMRRTLQNLT